MNDYFPTLVKSIAMMKTDLIIVGEVKPFALEIFTIAGSLDTYGVDTFDLQEATRDADVKEVIRLLEEGVKQAVQNNIDNYVNTYAY